MNFFRKISVFSSLICVLTLTAGATYYDVPFLPDMEEYVEIQELLPEIIPELNDILAAEGYETTIAAENISLDEGYPIYLNENYFSPDITTPEDLLSLVAAQDHYIWKIPVDIGNQVMLISLGKGYPVREEVREFASSEFISELENGEGKWGLTTIEFVPENMLYTQKVKAANLKADQVLFVNGLTGSNLQMAICIDGDEFEGVLSLTDAEIDYESKGLLRKANGTFTFTDGGYYSYTELQESIGMLSDDVDDSMLDTEDPLMALSGGVSYTLLNNDQLKVLAAVAIIVFFIFVIKIKSKNAFRF